MGMSIFVRDAMARFGKLDVKANSALDAVKS